MLTWIIIIAFCILASLLAVSLCSVSGRASRREEADEVRRELATK